MAHKVDPKDKMGVEPQRRVSSLRLYVALLPSNVDFRGAVMTFVFVEILDTVDFQHEVRQSEQAASRRPQLAPRQMPGVQSSAKQ